MHLAWLAPWEHGPPAGTDDLLTLTNTNQKVDKFSGLGLRLGLGLELY